MPKQATEAINSKGSLKINKAPAQALKNPSRRRRNKEVLPAKGISSETQRVNAARHKHNKGALAAREAGNKALRVNAVKHGPATARRIDKAEAATG